MLILKVLFKIILLPVVFVLFFASWLIEVGLKLGEFPLGLLMLFVGGGIVYYVFSKNWTNVFLLSLIFAGVTAVMTVCMFVRDMCDEVIHKIITF